jgi:hypothetical protein
MSTKCIAFSNNDVILVAWTFAHKLEDCVGCDVRRIPAELANIHSDEPQGQSLPAMAGFPGDPNAGGDSSTLMPALSARQRRAASNPSALSMAASDVARARARRLRTLASAS